MAFCPTPLHAKVHVISAKWKNSLCTKKVVSGKPVLDTSLDFKLVCSAQYVVYIFLTL